MSARAQDTAREAWLKERSKAGIGGSDCAKILTEGAFAWWSRATGRTPPDPETEAMRWGRRLESAILDEFEDHHLARLAPGGRMVRQGYQLTRHREDDWIIGTPDAPILIGDDAASFVDAKFHDQFFAATFGAPGEDADTALPLYHWSQGQHYCHLLDVDVGFFAVLSGRMRIYPVSRSPKYAAEIVPFLRAVWQCVLDDRAPDLDDSREAAAYVRELHPNPRDEVIELPEQADEWACDLARARAAKGQAGKTAKALDTKLLAALAGAKRGVGGLWLATRVDNPGHEDVDAARLKAEEPEVFERFKRVVDPYSWVKVTERTGRAG